MSGLRQEIRAAARGLARAPGLSLAVVLCIALGAAAVGTAFGAVDAVLLRPLPYPAADRLVMVWERLRDGSNDQLVVSYPDFADWRERSRTVRQLAAFAPFFPTLSGDGEPEKLLGSLVSTDFFPLLGARPHLGRLFTPDEDRPGGNTVVVLGHGLWRRRFGGDRQVLGRTLQLDGESVTVVGVLPADFRHPEPTYLEEKTEVWMPLGVERDTLPRRLRFLRILGQLAPDASLPQAQGELAAIAGQLEREQAETNEGIGARVVPLGEQLHGDVRRPLLLALAAAALILLIACANVSSLLLARATGRTRDTAVRAALGAGPTLLARPALVESLLLAVAGGALGLTLAAWSLPALVAASPAPIPGVEEIGVSARAFALTFAACAAAALLAALVPALRAARSAPSGALKEGTPGAGSLRGARLLALWVAAEVALSLPLLAGAGLLARSLAGLAEVPLGFDAADVLTARIELSEARYPEPAQRRAFFERLLSTLAATPEIDDVAITSGLPLTILFDLRRDVPVEPGAGSAAAPEEITAGYRVVSPGYFETLRIPLLEGRPLSPRDRAGTPDVALVNQTFARRAWPGQSPLGRRVILNRDGKPQRVEVVGVVGDIRHEGPSLPSIPEVFVPFDQIGPPVATLVLRSAGTREALAGRIRSVVRDLDPEVAAAGIRPMEELTRRAVATPRFQAVLAGMLAGTALLLAAAGLYGVTAYAVSRRTREIGIRMALGANRSSILSLIVWRSLLPVLAGTLLGLAAAVPLARLLAGLLHGVSPGDPVVFAVAALAPLGVALAAAWLPARRAAAVQPLSALRTE